MSLHNLLDIQTSLKTLFSPGDVGWAQSRWNSPNGLTQATVETKKLDRSVIRCAVQAVNERVEPVMSLWAQEWIKRYKEKLKKQGKKKEEDSKESTDG